MVVVSHFNHSYLPQGVVLIKSILEHSSDAEVMIYAHDDETSVKLRKLFNDQVTILSLDQVLDRDPGLSAAWRAASGNEKFFLLTPSIMIDALAQTDGRFVTYVDADLMIFSPLATEALQCLESYDVGLTTHYLSARNKHLSIFGRYNVGWIYVRNSPGGLEFLDWWASKCFESVSTREPDSPIFGDQKYLDAVEDLGVDVAILDSHFVNVGPWSTVEPRDLYSVQSFHFSRARLSKTLFVLGTSFHSRERPSKELKMIYAQYRRALECAHKATATRIPYLPQSLGFRTLAKALFLGDWIAGSLFERIDSVRNQ
jgi:hypothetical protein